VATGLIDARRIVRAEGAEYLAAETSGDTRKEEGPSAHFRRNPRSTRQPSTAILVDGIATALCGYIVCGLFGPYLMSWLPFILVGLVSAMIKMRQQDRAGDTARDSL